MEGSGTNGVFNVGTGRYHDASDMCGTKHCQKENDATIQDTGGGEAYAPPHLSINFIIYAGPPNV